MLSKIEPLRNQKFAGVYYVPIPPIGTKIKAAILIFHGGEGAQGEWHYRMAEFFASYGFAVIALDSWGGRTSPAVQRDIDLSLSFEALRFLKERYPKVGLHGASRGAEQAMLIGILAAGDNTLSTPDAIAVHAATDKVEWAWINGKGADLSIRQWRFDRSPAELNTYDPILIERYRGPLFISHGEADESWKIVRSRRLVARRGSLPTKTLFLANQEHVFVGQGELLRKTQTLKFFQDNLL